MTVTNQVHGNYIQTMKDDKDCLSLIFVIVTKPSHSICRAASFLISTSLWIATFSFQLPHQLHTTDGDCPRKDYIWATYWLDMDNLKISRLCYEGYPDEFLSNMQTLPLQILLS